MADGVLVAKERHLALRDVDASQQNWVGEGSAQAQIGVRLEVLRKRRLETHTLRGLNLHVELQAGQQAGRVGDGYARFQRCVRNSEEKSVRRLSPVRRMVTVSRRARCAGLEPVQVRRGIGHGAGAFRDNADGPGPR